MPKNRIVFTDVKDFEEKYLFENQPENCEFIMYQGCLSEKNGVNIDEIKDIEILSVFSTSRITAGVLNKLPNLKIIAARSTGYSHIDMDYCKEHNIAVVNTPRYGECTVAEFAFALLLNVIRKIDIAYRDLQNGIINVRSYMGNDLYGKTLGIIGTGAIGCHACQIAAGFGMKILAYDPFPKEEMKKLSCLNYVDIDELYRESDVISIHAPSTKENHHMISDDAFNKMKKGVIIINTARGEIVDTEALYRAIKNEIVAGAGLDVLECEDVLMQEDKYLMKADCIDEKCLISTLINHKLVELPNVIVTPHVAYDTIEAIHRILKITVDNIKGYLAGNIQNRVT